MSRKARQFKAECRGELRFYTSTLKEIWKFNGKPKITREEILREHRVRHWLKRGKEWPGTQAEEERRRQWMIEYCV